ncbi:MAG: hypothetical protein N0C90_23905 [Candidatus Thiodiazotropha endolucinida]|nr:hypothetical protein [Candidatus Thiodiazotropha taylori]MCW4264398.1 hypothetical protein [Candidatus Thiodiazotropha endolucinida]
MKSLKEQLQEIRNSLQGEEKRASSTKTSRGDTKVIVTNGKKYKDCPVCGCRLKLNRFDKHLAEQHGPDSKRPEGSSKDVRKSPKSKGDEFVSCPKCKKQVKAKNLKKHLRRIHGERVLPKKSARSGKKSKVKFTTTPVNKMTPSEAAEYRKSLEDVHLGEDRAISEYLKKNPSKDEMGKFGVPQDKYRWGFYGSKSMEYDVWGKGDKEK